jgi:protein kinase-like protein
VVDGWTVPGFTHVRELGRGASGQVVLAVDDVTQTTVAIKYLDPRMLADERFMHRYRTVARRLSQLEDPNVVDLYEFVEAPDGSAAAIVMERVGGVSLRRILDTQGPAGPLAGLALLGGTLVGLAAAHAIDVIHQALQPTGILIDGAGNSRLTDFAITPPAHPHFPSSTGGSPAYLAPELWHGATPSEASDIYAATVVFFECLTGRPPYDGKPQAIAKGHRDAPIPADAVPGPLRGLITQGLAKDPADRPASAADFLGVVEAAAVKAYGPAWEAQGRSRLAEMAEAAAVAPAPAEIVPAAAPAPAPARPGRKRRRGRVVLAVLGAVIVAAGGLGAAVYGMERENRPANPPPAAATPPPVTPSATPTVSASPSGPANAVNPPVLADRIDRAAGHQGAAFVHRRTGCCVPAASAQGVFRVASGADPYQLTLSSLTTELRRPTTARLVGDVGYVQLGGQWQPVPQVGRQTRGYAALAARVRWSSSVANITALLDAAATVRRTGRTFRGTVALARLTGQREVGPLYTELARASRADRVTFAITLDAKDLPRQLAVTLQPPSGRPLVLNTQYSGWGRGVAITAPR